MSRSTRLSAIYPFTGREDGGAERLIFFSPHEKSFKVWRQFSQRGIMKKLHEKRSSCKLNEIWPTFFSYWSGNRIRAALHPIEVRLKWSHCMTITTQKVRVQTATLSLSGKTRQSDNRLSEKMKKIKMGYRFNHVGMTENRKTVGQDQSPDRQTKTKHMKLGWSNNPFGLF